MPRGPARVSRSATARTARGPSIRGCRMTSRGSGRKTTRLRRAREAPENVRRSVWPSRTTKKVAALRTRQIRQFRRDTGLGARQCTPSQSIKQIVAAIKRALTEDIFERARKQKTFL
jgi:hypothetical protein